MIIMVLADNAIQLVPDGTLLLHLVIVVGMVAVLNRTLLRPVNRVLADREAQTSGRLNEAQKVRESCKNGLQRYERGLRDARSAAYRLIEAERAEALQQREEKLAQVREEIRSWIKEERAEIDTQAEESRRALAVESGENALRIGSRILHRSVNSSTGF